MNQSKQNDRLDELLNETLTRKEVQLNFDKWKQTHKNQIEVYQNQTASTSTKQTPAIWRIIMRSKMIKLAASIIIVGVLLYMAVGENGVSKAYALEQVLENMENVPWMHCVSKMKDVGGSDGESWHSFTAGITAARSEDGAVLFIDNKANDMYLYSPDANEITAMASPMSMLLEATSPYGYLKNLIGMLGKIDGAQAASKSDVLNGKKVEVFEVKVPGHAAESVEGESVWRFFVDARNHLLLLGEVSKYDSAGAVIAVGNMVMDYPESGPDSIYALSVPGNARIVDDRPGPGIEELTDIFRKKRQRFASYVLIRVRFEGSVVRQVDINYIKGDLTRSSEKHFKYLNYGYGPRITYWDKVNAEELCTQIESDIANFRNIIADHQMFGPPSIDLWDGRNSYWKPKSEEPAKISDSPGRGIVSVFHFWPIAGRIGRIVNNDYSTSNGLVAVQIDRGTRYFDPLHDYICVRWESPGDGDAKLRVEEVQEFARTESGLWYPRTEKWRSVVLDENGREVSQEAAITTNYYVQLLPSLPDSFFDKSKILAEDATE